MDASATADETPPDGEARPEVADALTLVPMLEAYFRRAQSEMPAAIREVFESHRLTARHGAVLVQLTSGRPLSVTELAHRLTVSLSTASELVGDLDRAGLLERRADAANRRRTLVTLADGYRAAYEEFVAQRSAPLLRVMQRLEPRDREGFARGLAAWADEVRHW